MLQNIKNGKTALLQAALCAVLALVQFLCLHLLATWMLSRFHHFDRYFSLATWIIILISALIHSFFLRKSPVVLVASSLVFSLFCLIISLVWAGENALISVVLLRILAFLIFVACFFFCFFVSKTKKQRKKKIRFRP